MLQLLGYRAWRMHPDDAFLSVDDVRAGAQRAERKFEDRIFDVTYAELSRADRAFLPAMAQDGKVTSRADLMDRLGKPSGYFHLQEAARAKRRYWRNSRWRLLLRIARLGCVDGDGVVARSLALAPP